MVPSHGGRYLWAGRLEADPKTHHQLRTALGLATDATRRKRPRNSIQSDRLESLGRRTVGWNRIRGPWGRALQLQLREVLSLDDSAPPRCQLPNRSQDRAPCGNRLVFR